MATAARILIPAGLILGAFCSIMTVFGARRPMRVQFYVALALACLLIGATFVAVSYVKVPPPGLGAAYVIGFVLGLPVALLKWRAS